MIPERARTLRPFVLAGFQFRGAEATPVTVGVAIASNRKTWLVSRRRIDHGRQARRFAG